MITLIAREGSDVESENVSASMAETHMAADDRYADEARCLLAWQSADIEADPVAWDGAQLFFAGEDIPADAEPVQVRHISADDPEDDTE